MALPAFEAKYAPCAEVIQHVALGGDRRDRVNVPSGAQGKTSRLHSYRASATDDMAHRIESHCERNVARLAFTTGEGERYPQRRTRKTSMSLPLAFVVTMSRYLLA